MRLWHSLLVVLACLCSSALCDGWTGENKPGLIELDAVHFQDVMTSLQGTADWVIMEFYAHWCPACQAFQPTYEAAAEALAGRDPTAAPRLAVARLDCANYQDTCNEFDFHGFPTVMVGTAAQFKSLSPDGLKTLSLRKRTKERLISEVEAALGAKLLMPASSAGEAGQGLGAAVKKHLQILKPLKAPAQAHAKDVEGATIKSWHHMWTPSLLKGAQARAALDAWLRLLAGHPIARCRASAEAAMEQLPRAWPAGAETPTDFAALAGLPICEPAAFQGEWGGCKGSQADTRGYTCGLWQLLHVLAAELPDQPLAGAEWLAAVKGYVQHFFQCTDCSRHFVAMATSPEAEAVQSKRDAVMWIWRAHNMVNARLAKEDAERGDPLFPHVQWPTPDACVSCSSSSSSGDGAAIVWNEEAVYAFLQRFYELDNAAVTDAVRPRHSSKQSSWFDAVVLCTLVAGAVYAVLRKSAQYSVRGVTRLK